MNSLFASKTAQGPSAPIGWNTTTLMLGKSEEWMGWSQAAFGAHGKSWNERNGEAAVVAAYGPPVFAYA